MNKGNTVIDALVTLTTVGILALIIIAGVMGWGGFSIKEWLFPRQAQAQQQRELVEELREQNRLLRTQQKKEAQ